MIKICYPNTTRNVEFCFYELRFLSPQILQLEKRLHDQVAVRGALEQALGYKSSSRQITNQASIPKVIITLKILVKFLYKRR